jgi:20S proteasome subunit beta 3
MRYKLKMYQLREGKDMKPETFARLVGTTLYEHRASPFYLMPTVIGIENGKPILVNYDSIGTYSGNEAFVFQGSSATNMASLCESLYKDDMNK